MQLLPGLSVVTSIYFVLQKYILFIATKKYVLSPSHNRLCFLHYSFQYMYVVCCWYAFCKNALICSSYVIFLNSCWFSFLCIATTSTISNSSVSTVNPAFFQCWHLLLPRLFFDTLHYTITYFFFLTFSVLHVTFCLFSCWSMSYLLFFLFHSLVFYICQTRHLPMVIAIC